MDLKERVYSVLIVSAAAKLNTALSDLLPESRYEPVASVANVSAAKRIRNERDFDFVIVNSPLPDDAGIRFAVDAAGSRGSVVLLLVRAEVLDEVRDRVVEHGVFTLPKPLSMPMLALALDWMASARERLRGSEKRTQTVEEKMEEIRLVNHAKWLLISQLQMDEPQAHRYIEKQAMDLCVSKREVAEDIIRLYG